MSYYHDVADRLEREGEHEGALVIRSLYDKKVELEVLVKRISDARDLLIKEMEHEGA